MMHKPSFMKITDLVKKLLKTDTHIDMTIP